MACFLHLAFQLRRNHWDKQSIEKPTLQTYVSPIDHLLMHLHYPINFHRIHLEQLDGSFQTYVIVKEWKKRLSYSLLRSALLLMLAFGIISLGSRYRTTDFVKYTIEVAVMFF